MLRELPRLRHVPRAFLRRAGHSFLRRRRWLFPRPAGYSFPLHWRGSAPADASVLVSVPVLALVPVPLVSRAPMERAFPSSPGCQPAPPGARCREDLQLPEAAPAGEDCAVTRRRAAWPTARYEDLPPQAGFRSPQKQDRSATGELALSALMEIRPDSASRVRAVGSTPLGQERKAARLFRDAAQLSPLAPERALLLRALVLPEATLRSALPLVLA